MLTDKEIKNIKFDGKIRIVRDHSGLFLRVSKTKKSWQLSFMKNGKMNHFYSKHPYPDMSLLDARKWAAALKEDHSSRPALLPVEKTFGHWLDFYFQKQLNGGIKQQTIHKEKLVAKKYLSAWLTLDITKLKSPEALGILNKIHADKKYSTVHKVKSLMSNAFISAKNYGVIDYDPTHGLEKELKHQNVRKNHAALVDKEDFGQLVRDIETLKCDIQTLTALKLVMLVFVRSKSIRFCKWSEIDFNRKVWVVPDYNTKKHREFIVPLSTQVISLLKKLHSVTANEVYAFGSNGRELGEHRIRRALYSIGYVGENTDTSKLTGIFKKHSPHGFRASLKTLTNEVLQWKQEVARLQMSHLLKDPNGTAYERSQFMPERIMMMQLWSDFCDVLKTGDEEKIEVFIKQNKGAF